MLAFVFFIAVFNLAVGYAWGKGLGIGSLMELIPRRTPKAEVEDIDEEEALTRPVAAAQQKAESPPQQAAVDQTPSGSEEPEPAAIPATKKSPTKQDVLASLAGIRAKMSDASAELKQNQADPTKFGESATKLQQANQDYLEQAEGTIKHLDELSAGGDQSASASREAVATGKDGVAEMSQQLDSMIEAGLDTDEARARLVEKADEIDLASRHAQESAEAAAGTAAANESAPSAEGGEVRPTVDQVFDRLDALLEGANDETRQHVAALRIDPIEGHEDDQALVEALEVEVGRLAHELLGESQSCSGDRPTILLLEGDSFEQATERLERIRQQVESTTFGRAGEEIQATITCAVTDADSGNNRDQLIDQLNQALEESTRLGTNRTFHHDGVFPTPVPEKVIKVESRTIAID